MVSGRLSTGIDRIADHFRTLPAGLADFRGSWRSILIWPAIIAVLTIISWIGLGLRLEADRKDVERFALKESATLAQAYAGHLERAFDSIDQIALHVKFEWELSGGRLRLETIRERGLFPASELVLVTIVDANGMPVTSTLPLDKQVSLADREHFKVHKNRPTDFLFISKIVTGRVSGRPSIQFSRRLANPDGTFGGVVVVSVNPAYFVHSFDVSSLGMKGLLTLMGEDGQTRVSRVGNMPVPPQSPVLNKVPDFRQPHGSMLLQGGTWFADGRNRFVGWQTLKSQPFVAMVGLDEQEIMAPYLASRAATIRLAIIASVAALVIALFAMVAAARFALTKRQAEVVRHAYRLATEIGNDGFYICQAVYDKDARIVDFVLVDCNQRGAEMIARRREDLLGMRISDLYPQPFLDKLLELGRKTMALGTYEEEHRLGSGSRMKARWIHRKLIRSGNSVAVTVRDISEAKQHVEELERRGNEDALTSLHNRHWLHSFLPAALDEATRDGKMLALLFIDIDGFKAVNDSMGHAAGDELLRLAAQRLHSVVRPEDKVVRLGGDEFLIVLEAIEQRDDAAHIAHRILEMFGEKFRLQQGLHTVGVSVGISLFPDDGKDAKTLLQNADIAMYSAKQSGKGQYRFYDPVFFDRLRARLDIERKLREALDLDQFEMFYQPRVDMASGRICGLEALIRWRHPQEGLVEPLRFIHVAEETGLIQNLGMHAMEKVCAQLADWRAREKECVPVSINVSPRQFHEGNLKDLLASRLARHGIAPELVEIEVTESSMMGETSEVSMEMESLRAIGVKLLVDDFGTGYSSLSQLQKLDMDGLKIDRAFTAELGKSPEGEVFFTAIVTMAHALGMRVVAEGVETRQQVDILKRLACDEIQGYYVSRPVPASEIPALIENRALVAA
ncbi:bifunctional diguanylate cyclase/phosphodiesterase [Noviherbaspirillum massiliense]|uniref:bifunctional diguanylate cyclase/phosphodiesterase n=1 Tax=Noviherbaspirillum massiliense TaxID=1465823 RepID=UPI0002E67FEA|nr:EAL domain-containing protein [Noviherbaspirillum massiliense]